MVLSAEENNVRLECPSLVYAAGGGEHLFLFNLMSALLLQGFFIGLMVAMASRRRRSSAEPGNIIGLTIGGT